jgi:LysM repeat protein
MLEQKNRTRTRVRFAVFIVLSIHVLGLMALLMQGCRKPPEGEGTTTDTNTVPATNMEATNPASMETNTAPMTTLTPTPPETNVPFAAPGMQEYVVAKGDSFYTIAKKFSVTMKAIQDANPNVQPTKLQIGQKLQVPAPSSGPGAAPNAAAPMGIAPGSGGEQVYTVKSGDTLTKIASEFSTTVKALRSENSLTTDKIKVGQKLKIPAKGAAPATAPAPPSAPSPAPAATTPSA